MSSVEVLSLPDRQLSNQSENNTSILPHVYSSELFSSFGKAAHGEKRGSLGVAQTEKEDFQRHTPWLTGNTLIPDWLTLLLLPLKYAYYYPLSNFLVIVVNSVDPHQTLHSFSI